MLSFALSIVIVTLSILFANWILKIRVTAVNSIIIILIFTIVPLAVYFILRHFRGETEEVEDLSDYHDEEPGVSDEES